MEYNLTNKNINIKEGYDSDDELHLECGNEIVKIPYKPINSSRKRLLCNSVINKGECLYKDYCTYAHTLGDQNIDADKKIVYQIILDKNLMNYQHNINIVEIYKNLLRYIKLCENCNANTCTGGYNCRNGIFTKSLQICRNDLLTGNCLNKTMNIIIDDAIFKKINNIQISEVYIGCINGHHLSNRGLICYYKFLNEFEKSNNNEKLHEYIEKDQYDDISSDEEIDAWMKKT